MRKQSNIIFDHAGTIPKDWTASVRLAVFSIEYNSIYGSIPSKLAINHGHVSFVMAIMLHMQSSHYVAAAWSSALPKHCYVSQKSANEAYQHQCCECHHHSLNHSTSNNMSLKRTYICEMH